MVIVCAWSDVHVTGTSKLEEMQEGHPKVIYTNTDMHGGNSKFSSFVRLGKKSVICPSNGKFTKSSAVDSGLWRLCS